MKTIYQIQKDRVEEVARMPKKFWVDLVDPTEEEIQSVCRKLSIKKNDLLKALDKSEIPHIEFRENFSLFIYSIPYMINNNGRKKYRSYPFGVFFFSDGLLTVSLLEHPIKKKLQNSLTAEANFQKPNIFSIYLIGTSVEYYIAYLNEIQEDILQREKRMLKSPSNKDIETMLAFQKSLLYFTTSLQGNQALIEKIEMYEKITSVELDAIKEVKIELHQALEMARTYREILENTMSTYSSIISNNLNGTMKFLTSVTLIISIPTMISSFLGMNVFLGDFGTNPFSFLLIVLCCITITLILILILKKKNLL